jgi:hypothetical protein
VVFVTHAKNNLPETNNVLQEYPFRDVFHTRDGFGVFVVQIPVDVVFETIKGKEYTSPNIT